MMRTRSHAAPRSSVWRSRSCYVFVCFQFLFLVVLSILASYNCISWLHPVHMMEHKRLVATANAVLDRADIDGLPVQREINRAGGCACHDVEVDGSCKIETASILSFCDGQGGADCPQTFKGFGAEYDVQVLCRDRVYNMSYTSSVGAFYRSCSKPPKCPVSFRTSDLAFVAENHGISVVDESYFSFTHMLYADRTSSCSFHRRECRCSQLVCHASYTGVAELIPRQLSTANMPVQLTVDRFASFRRLLKRWKGPVSAVVFSDDVGRDMLKVREVQASFPLVVFHIVLAGQGLYPVNTLRNVAMNKATTDWLFMLDVDFVPSEGLFEYLSAGCEKWASSFGMKNGFVVPAFQIDGGKDVPSTKIAAKAILQSGVMHQVHNDPGREIAHKPVDYARWKDAPPGSDPYEAKYRFPFEPYILAHKSVPRYDSRFAGYGNDKAVQSYEMNAAGWGFVVLPDHFVVHLDHARAPWVSEVSSTPRKRNEENLMSFFADIVQRYSPARSPGKPPAGFQAVAASKPGESCTDACRSKGLLCRRDLFVVVNTCDALRKDFDCSQCSEMFFGSDLPASRHADKVCLTNSKMAEYASGCGDSDDRTRRLCPCSNYFS